MPLTPKSFFELEEVQQGTVRARQLQLQAKQNHRAPVPSSSSKKKAEQKLDTIFTPYSQREERSLYESKKHRLHFFFPQNAPEKTPVDFL